MVNELDTLESKVAQVVLLCSVLRAENLQLRQQLDQADQERQRLADLINAARARIEQLAHQLPEPDAVAVE